MPRKTRAAPGWEHYFPIPRGRELDVELVKPPLPVRGRGMVVRRTSAALHLRLEVAGGFLVPRIEADLTLTYVREGGGNRGRLDVQVGARRESFSDEDVAIRSEPARRAREISPSVLIEGKREGAVLRVTEGECRISVRGWVVRVMPAPSRT